MSERDINIQGTLQTSERNTNGRIYSEDLLRCEIERVRSASGLPLGNWWSASASYRIVGFPTGRYRARRVFVNLKRITLYYQIDASPTRPTVLIEADLDSTDELPDEIVAEFLPDEKSFDDKKKHGWVRLLSPDELIEFLVKEDM